MNRRQFLNSLIISTTGLGLLTSAQKSKVWKLTILHTNDTHSQIDAFPNSHQKYPGAGGVNARKLAIDEIKKTTDHVLLLDAGDIFQGTPYFNLYGGKVEFEVMSALKYDAATMGNHDFDGGLAGFNTALKYANFPFICSNYDFSETVLNKKTVPFKIFRKGSIKIGVIGIGVALEGLVSESLYRGTKYLAPFKQAQNYANLLREEHKCNLIICLSHLGYKQPDSIDDVTLAKSTSNIDIIIGGHTHTFLDKPEIHHNILGKQVLINQVGWAGLQLGKIDLFFSGEEDNSMWTSMFNQNNISI